MYSYVPKYEHKPVPEYVQLRTHNYVPKYIPVCGERIGTYLLLLRTKYGLELSLMNRIAHQIPFAPAATPNPLNTPNRQSFYVANPLECTSESGMMQPSLSR